MDVKCLTGGVTISTEVVLSIQSLIFHSNYLIMRGFGLWAMF